VTVNGHSMRKYVTVSGLLQEYTTPLQLLDYCTKNL